MRASHREVAMIGYCNHLLSRALERLEAVEVSIEMNSAEGLDPQSGLLTDCKQDLRRVITELENAQGNQERTFEAEVILLTE